MNRRVKQIITFSLICIGGLITGFVIYFIASSKLSLPPTSGSKTIAALNDKVEITFDAMGIPQIWATNEHDGYFALGYQHAADRMFQLELIRRIARGELSELLGPSMYNLDLDQRRIGHSRIAKEELHKLNERNRAVLQAYCDGINEYSRSCTSLPFEFKLLPGGFTPWSIEDCLALLSFQSWFSHGLMMRDQFFIDLIEKLEYEDATRLVTEYPKWAPTTVADESTQSSSPVDETTSQKAALLLLRSMQMSFASNAWVVSGSRTRSGKPMLAADPHLEVTRLPQFWYYVGLHIESHGIDVVGITTPGVPVIIMGHNNAAAYAFTAGGIDITEYYVESVNPENKNQYQRSDGWTDFKQVIETINISGEDEPRLDTLRFTEDGPVMIDNDTIVYTMHWAGYDVDLNDAITAGTNMHRMADFDSFRQAVTKLGALNANWVYADTAGNIGYQLGTPIPIRAAGVSHYPLPGWDEGNRWNGFYDSDHTPYEKNPLSGWLATCNNKPAEMDYPLLGNFFANRILRIGELLGDEESLTIDDMKRFQLDRTDSYLLRWKDEAATVLDSLEQQELAQSIRNWSGATALDSRETLILRLFLDELIKAIFEDELGAMARAVSDSWLDNIYFGPDSPWFDDITTEVFVESRIDMATKAMKQALEYAGDAVWGERNSLSMRHPMADLPLISAYYDLSFGPWPRGGTNGTLNVSFTRRDNDSTYKTIVAPSWRFVIDMAAVDQAEMVLPAGNSGNPESDHFFDFNQMWRDGDYWNVPSRKQVVKEKALSTLTLYPTDWNGAATDSTGA